jgi:hypothetical protein
VNVRDSSHRQARQVANDCTGSLGHRDRQRSNSGRLVHHKEDLPMRGKGAEDFPEPVLVVWQSLVEERLAGPVEGHRMVAGLPDVQTDEHVNVLLIQNHPP